MPRRLMPAMLWTGLMLAVAVVPGLNVARAQGPTGVAPRVALVDAVGTAFTYQGQLKSGTSPFNGTCDLQFTLYDALLGGSTVGQPQAAPGLNIVNGLFSTKLDFGPGIFNGSARYLQIATKCGTDSSFTVLNPRQELTPTPYALNADTLDGQHATSFWSLSGNSTTSPGQNFLGTTDNVGLSLRANNRIGWQLVPGGPTGTDTGNIIGGSASNSVTSGVKGATIGGGGSPSYSCGPYSGMACINRVTDDYGTVAGGMYNYAGDAAGTSSDASYATVGGGYSNMASGSFATVPGGSNAAATHYGEMAYANGRFATDGDAQTSTYVLRGVTTNSTMTELFLDGSSARITIPAGRTMTYDALVVGRASDGTSAGYHLTGVVKNVGGTVSSIPTPSNSWWEDTGAIFWDAGAVANNTTKSFAVRVVGGSITIRWVATVRTVQVQY